MNGFWISFFLVRIDNSDATLESKLHKLQVYVDFLKRVHIAMRNIKGIRSVSYFHYSFVIYLLIYLFFIIFFGFFWGESSNWQLWC